MKKIIALCLLAFLALTTAKAQTSYALNFNRNFQQYVSVAHSSIFNITSQLTIEMWIKTTDGREQYLTTKGDNSWYIAINGGGSGSGKVTFFLNGTNSGWLTSAQTVNDGNWHHIACTYNGSNRQIYIDGALSVSASTTGNISTGTSNVEIGSRNVSNFYTGNMDELRIWSMARTQSEIQTNMNAYLSASSSNLSAYYKFDNCCGTTITDATSNANNGALQNGVNWTDGVTIYNLLDNVGLSTSTTAASAFSLRKLSTTYNGSTIQVRRSSDNTTQNIGFTASGNLDTAALKTFVGANNGFVSIWYDQSGNGNNAANSTAAAQPSIVTSGIINRIASSGQPVVTTASTSQSLSFTVSPSITGSNLTANAVAYMQNTTGINARLVSLSNGSSSDDWNNNNYVGAIIGNSTANNVRADRDYSATLNSKGLAAFASSTPGVITSLFNGTNHQMFVNGGGGATVASSGAFGTTFGRLFNHSNDAGPSGWAGGAWEIIVFPSALSTTDRQTVENNQLAYYNITNANVSTINLSNGTLSPSFATNTTAYTATVTNAISTITVTPTVEITGATAQVRVNGGSYATVASGAASAALSVNVGSNTVDIKVTALDGTTVKTYTVTVTRAASTDATLSALTISSGTLSPTFASGTTSYTASVTNATSSITVTPTRTQANATIQVRVNGGSYSSVTSGSASSALSLNVGSNTINVRVTAQDGTTTQTYTITVIRVSTDATLSALTLSSGTLSPSFASGTLSYTATVNTSSIAITPTNNNNATIQARVNGGSYGSVTSGNASSALGLNLGSNTIDVFVTAQDGTTTQTYTITVTRLSADATLSALTISSGTLSPTFATGTQFYTVSVSNATTSFTVTPTRTQANATIQVNVNGGSYATVTSGSASSVLNLNTGSNAINVRVTAQDGTTIQVYAIIVTRLSNDATLSALTISTGTLSPSFASGTTSYTASVTASNITITPTRNQANATLQVRINGGSYSPAFSGSGSGFSLNLGSNTINILVTAQDGTTTQTYTINIGRGSSNADLFGLTISSGTLSPSFTNLTTSYTATVASNISSITVTPTKADANATIQARVNGGSYSNVTSGSASSALSLNAGSNTIDVLVTAQDLSTKTYTVTVTRISNDATLSALSLSNGTLSPSFTSGTTNYTALVSGETPYITVTPTANQATSSIQVRINGGSYVSVTSGVASIWLFLSNMVPNNTVDVRVTAEDGTIQTYTITVYRGSEDADLGYLATSVGTISPSFARATTSYTTTVSASTIRIIADANQGNATVTVNGIVVPRFTISSPISLNLGTNTITVVVTAQNGFSTKTYTITVTRVLSTDATLSALAISSGTLSPTFASGTTSYTASVTNATSSITVTPTRNQALATIQARVNGGSYSSVTSGSASGSLSLNVGSNTINVLVTAEDGTTQTYTITVTRISNDATLSALTLSSGTLSPTFASGTTSYTASVTNGTSSITVTPTRNQANATIRARVNGGSYSNVTSGSASGSLSLNVGSNTINVLVTAQDGITTQTYTITVTRLSADATLSALTISSGTLSPSYASGTTSYTASVTNGTSSITLTPTRSQANATIQVRVNGGSYSSVTSGSASGLLSLNVGSNTINVLVTAQDGTTTNTYTIIVTRLALPVVTVTPASYTYNGTQQGPSSAVTTNTGTGTSYTFSYNGTASDGTTYNTSATPPTKAGSYFVTATVAANGNFASASSSATAYTISKAILTITAANQSIIYETPASIVTSAGTYSLTGFVNGETATAITSGTVTYNTTYTNTTAAGTLGVTITPVPSGFNAANYSFTTANGTITITCNTNTWTGATSTAWNVGSNWCSGTAPSSAADIILPAGITNQPLLASNTIIGALSIASDATLGLNGNTLTINGAVTGTGQLKSTATSSLVIAGSAGTIYFESSNNTIKDLTLNSSATATIGSALNITSGSTPGTVNIGSSATLTTGGFVTLKSDILGTARVANSAGTISGDVSVERYIPAKAARYFSFLASPVTQSIFNGWQQQIYVTGAGTGGQTCGSTSNNGGATDKYNSNWFDKSNSNSPSMHIYNATAVNGSRWVSIANTNAINLVPGKGFRVNVRGDRTQGTCADQLNSTISASPTAVTLKATGAVGQGNVTVTLNSISSTLYSLVGNPYPSPIDFTTLYAANSSNMYNSFWSLSPSNTGNYSTYSNGVLSNKPNGYLTTGGNASYLASGQAFLMLAKSAANGGTGSISFTEAMKTTGVIPNTAFFGTANNQLFRIAMTAIDSSKLDEAVVRFNNNGSNAYNPNWDALSLSAGSQTLASLKATAKLAIATRPDSLVIDTVKLSLSSVTADNFRFVFSDYQGIDSTKTIILRDKYLGVSHDVRANQVYNFTVTSDTASKGSNRFEVIFTKGGNPLPVNFVNVRAAKTDRGVAVNWKVAQPINIATYNVERSIDGVNFTTIATTKATTSNDYAVTDYLLPDAKVIYYRIQSVEQNGTKAYSQIARVSLNSKAEVVSIYPNPVKEVMNVTINTVENSVYTLRILNLAGKEVGNKAVIATKQSSINVSHLASGVYMVEFSNTKGEKSMVKMFKE